MGLRGHFYINSNRFERPAANRVDVVGLMLPVALLRG
jgi:hypothetical protein